MTILYLHGMGGGSDSRIPRILSQHYAGTDVAVEVNTYSFDPEIAAAQIDSWVKALDPDLIIGESLGSVHAVCISGKPHLYVSPAVRSAKVFGSFAFLALIPGVKLLLERKFKPREGDRQTLDFSFKTLRKYKARYRECMSEAGKDFSLAFFGTNDHYMKSGIVDIAFWKKHFGQYRMYEGSHYMEEEYIYSMLIPEIDRILSLSRE